MSGIARRKVAHADESDDDSHSSASLSSFEVSSSGISSPSSSPAPKQQQLQQAQQQRAQQNGDKLQLQAVLHQASQDSFRAPAQDAVKENQIKDPTDKNEVIHKKSARKAAELSSSESESDDEIREFESRFARKKQRPPESPALQRAPDSKADNNLANSLSSTKSSSPSENVSPANIPSPAAEKVSTRALLSLSPSTAGSPEMFAVGSPAPVIFQQEQEQLGAQSSDDVEDDHSVPASTMSKDRRSETASRRHLRVRNHNTRSPLDVIGEAVTACAEEMEEDLLMRGREGYGSLLRFFASEAVAEFELYNELADRFCDVSFAHQDTQHAIREQQKLLVVTQARNLRTKKLLEARQTQVERLRASFDLQNKADAYLASLST